MPAWCFACFQAGKDGPGEFWVRDFFDREGYIFNCYLCTECATVFQVPEAHPPKERAWRDITYGPVGVPYGRDATWDCLAVRRTQHRSDPRSSRTEPALVQHVENEIDMGEL